MLTIRDVDNQLEFDFFQSGEINTEEELENLRRVLGIDELKDYFKSRIPREQYCGDSRPIFGYPIIST